MALEKSERLTVALLAVRARGEAQSNLSKSANLNLKWYLGVAQLVARYLGVVEAASSSLVTQTKIV